MAQKETDVMAAEESIEAAMRAVAAVDLEDLTADLAIISLGVSRIAEDPLYEEEIDFARSPRATTSGGSTDGSCDCLGSCFPCTASQGSCVPGCSTYVTY